MSAPQLSLNPWLKRVVYAQSAAQTGTVSTCNDWKSMQCEFYHIGCNKAVIRAIIRFLLRGCGEPDTVVVWVK